MKRFLALLLPALLGVALLIPVTLHAASHDEYRLWDRKADAEADIEAALQLAREQDKRVLITFGANWCKDSRALASYYDDPEVAALFEAELVKVFVDVGMYHRNNDIAARYGIDVDEGVPAIVILNRDGEVAFRTAEGELSTALQHNALWARGYFADVLKAEPLEQAQ